GSSGTLRLPGPPDATAMYSVPPMLYAAAGAVIGEPVSYCHRIFPVRVSNASNFPLSSPVNTTPPEVTRALPLAGRSKRCRHLKVPVETSIALNHPVSGPTTDGNAPPR